MEPTRDYRATLNITLNDKDPGAFPQRGNLPAKEPEFQRRWLTMDLYAKSLSKPSPRGTFVLHDGPPYSNGNIHLGHALNKVAKDITCRFRSMQGYCAPYVPGWDNHGLPIENEVAKAFLAKKETPDKVTLRKACREYATNWVETQRQQFRRLGIRGDWDKPYLTMNYEFEAKIVEVFGELAEQGFIYRGLRPVMWSAVLETALADAEIEYEMHRSSSIYVRFPLKADPNGVFKTEAGGTANAYAIIWTTTPWTIPANLAIAAHPNEAYVTFDYEGNHYLIAEALLESVLKVIVPKDVQEINTDLSGLVSVTNRVLGHELEGLVFKHPLFDRESPLLMAPYVTMDTGTGLVHTAPGHGKEDFDTGRKYGLSVLNPVDEKGRYTAEAGEYDGVKFEGLRVTTFAGAKKNEDSPANVALVEALGKSGHLLRHSYIEHSYPHGWRCHSPLIFRATVQWFMNIDHDGFRQKALDAIQDVTWFPKESINRIHMMVANRPDWCLSRQRSWGVGIPAFYCDSCGEYILTQEAVAKVAAMTRAEGSDAWYAKTPAEILGADYVCPHCLGGAAGLRKETDVLDVWFDSGATHRAVLEDTETWPELTRPADVYLEGGDQHRGWFNSSLMLSLATTGKPPYKSVVTNGWTLDENGEAFSKSKGNGVNPLTVIEQSGADVLRCWVTSQNFMEDTRCGDNLLKQVGENYRRLRNTFRFLVNNLYDFDPSADSIPVAEMEEIDRWVLAKLNQLVQTATESYEVYEYHRVFHAALQFCTTELSAFYLDVLKDRLYASGKTWKVRRSAQTAMHEIAETMARLLAPILVHTCEEVWDYLKVPNKAESVHLAEFPTVGNIDMELLSKWEMLLRWRDEVNLALERARQDGRIGKPMEAKITLNLMPPSYDNLAPYIKILPSIFLVSQVEITKDTGGDVYNIGASLAEGVKCARCWLIKTDVGVNTDHSELCGRCAEAVSASGK